MNVMGFLDLSPWL